MYLKYVQIVNFKNLKNVRFEFSKGANTIIGENDSGKSNALTESNCFLILRHDIDDDTDDNKHSTNQWNESEQAQNNGNQEEPTIAPVNLELNVLVVERDDRCPTCLTCFGKDFPVRNDVENNECYQKQPERAEKAERSIKCRSF